MNPLKLADPVHVTKEAVGLAGTAVGAAGAVIGWSAGLTRDVLRKVRRPADDVWNRASDDPASDRSAADAGRANRSTAGSGSSPERPLPGADIVAVEPHAPTEPPVDVVGQALAAEQEPQNGFAHEARGASRDEEHGSARLQRAEVEAIADETDAALHGDADPEDHLTEPLLDPAQAKAIAAETETLRKAADTR